MARRRAEPPLLQLARGIAEERDTRPRVSRIDITLPFPPSVNKVYRMFSLKGRAMMRMTPEGKEYKASVAKTIGMWLGAYRPPGPPYSLVIWAWPPDHRQHDVDNMLKVTIDSIFEAIEANDNDILYLQISKPGPDARLSQDEARIVVVLEGEGDL